MSLLFDRALRAARLDSDVYEEVEADPAATGQAFWIVLASSLAGGLGAGWPHPGLVILATLVSCLGWLVWAWLTFWIGTRLLPEPQTRSSVGELLRTLGFASGPGVLRAAGIIPALRPVTHAVALIWMLAATIVAVRQALDYRTTLRALAVCAVGWLIQIGFLFLAFALTAVTSNPAY